ncbi:Leucine-rich repeat [Dillenia turbinata]|uniref:Leucine-rich repeat n=1 Tax=Dillenia turbinata TaxID=194707 RepID=A0AAN8WDX9_9MAGN
MVGSISKFITSKISSVMNLDQRADCVATALEALKGKRDDLKRKIDHAEFQGLECTNQVNRWLQRVEEAEAEANLITGKIRHQKKCFWCCPADICSRDELRSKVEKVFEEIHELMGEGNFDAILAEESIPDAVEEMPDRPTVGLDLSLDKVWQFLADDEIGIIGIYGMGGVGKTTLLKRINNGLITRSHNFDLVIWILVSKEFVAEKIQKAIGVRLGLSWEETEDNKERASRIHKVLRKKKLLLLLDDVWEGLNLEEMGIPLPDKRSKCKVIFTTRSMDVCSDMGADRKLRVEFLNERDSWQLFREKVGEILESPSIRHYAKTIVRKCGGLPLALITIGRAMANKESEQEWEYAIQALRISPSELRGMDDVFTLLRFSYDNLDNDALRSCFLYCSIFPEDYSVEKEQIIEYWIAEGFLDGTHESNAYNKGHAFIGALKVSCLLETGEEQSQVKMHDVIRSFALWIATATGRDEKKFLIQSSVGLTEAPRVQEWGKAERISLFDNFITALPETPVCPNLSTLLLHWNSGLSRMANGFFQYMPVLRVLDLSFTSLREIPESIGHLVELRHLNLSGTKVITLPKELGSLTKLRHLDLQRTYSLRTVPSEVILGLYELRILNLYYSYSFWEGQEHHDENEVSFSDLESLRHLIGVGITVSELTTLQKLSGYRHLLKCIQFLYITACQGLFYLQLATNSGDGERLRRLSINNCCDLKYLVICAGAGKKWLPSLEVLALHCLPNLTTVWKNSITQDCLQNLQSINIWYCHRLKNVSWLFQLPRLEVVYLFYCNGMEEVIGEDEVVLGELWEPFLSLRTVSIRNLPKLKSICPWKLGFPSLERIAIISCPNLRKLPLRPQHSSMLPKVYGSRQWWDGLEWDDPSTKTALAPCFVAS